MAKFAIGERVEKATDDDHKDGIVIAVFPTTDGNFRYAVDLIRFIKGLNTPFCVGAACYPEGHIESAHKHDDWDVAAAKELDLSDKADGGSLLRLSRNGKLAATLGENRTIELWNPATVPDNPSGLCGVTDPRPRSLIRQECNRLTDR